MLVVGDEKRVVLELEALERWRAGDGGLDDSAFDADLALGGFFFLGVCGIFVVIVYVREGLGRLLDGGGRKEEGRRRLISVGSGAGTSARGAASDTAAAAAAATSQQRKGRRIRERCRTEREEEELSRQRREQQRPF